MTGSHSPALYAGVTATLLALLALSTGMAYLDLGPLNLVLGLLIASIKALLVMLFFMHLLRGSAANRVAALLGFFMLALLGVLMMSDYVARNRHVPSMRPVQTSPYLVPIQKPSRGDPIGVAPARSVLRDVRTDDAPSGARSRFLDGNYLDTR